MWKTALFFWKVLPFRVRLLLEHNKLLIEALIPTIALVVGYALIISQLETRGEPPLDFPSAMYLSVITMAGVGYGDLYPKTQAARLVAFLYIPLGVCVVAYSIVNFMVKSVHDRLIHKLLNIRSLDDLGLDLNGDGQVTESEFLSFVLVECGKCDKKFLRTVKKTFDDLDRSKTGTLCIKDLQQYQHAQKNSLSKLFSRFSRHADSGQEEEEASAQNSDAESQLNPKPKGKKGKKTNMIETSSRAHSIKSTKLSKANAKKSVVV